MTTHSILEKLADKAGKEAAPRVDVADDVLALLTMEQTQPVISYRPLIWISSFASAAAACVAVATYWTMQATNGDTETLAGLYDTISWVAQ